MNTPVLFVALTYIQKRERERKNDQAFSARMFGYKNRKKKERKPEVIA